VFDYISEALIWLYWKIWYMLPDKCEQIGCCRKGVRGNENRIEGIITCDFCTSKWLDRKKSS
jgi:hypothetical protein